MMNDLTAIKKQKVTLSDYNFQRDIENRILLAQLTPFDHAVLEEILFSPIRAPIRKMAKNLETSEEQLMTVLQKLSQTALFTFDGDSIVIDKEVRRYFETEIEKFEDGFIPGMEFLQQLLKKVPIQTLPSWYSIPRTSNNIFDSLIEKYLATPQLFQRHMIDLNFGNPVITAIAQEVFASPDLEVPAKTLMKKFSLTPEEFHEHMVILEFHFVCCIRYHKSDNGWEEWVSPFQEWRDYLSFLKTTTPKPIKKAIQQSQPTDFAYVEELSALMQAIVKAPLPANGSSPLIPKLEQLRFIEKAGNHFHATDAGKEWLEMRTENRALYLYRHTAHLVQLLPPHAEKTVREAEKSIVRVLHSGWVFYDDFIQGVIVPLADHSPIYLKKTGRSWRYERPHYSAEELALIRTVIFEWLYETGITAIGSCDGRDCFSVTAFGQSLFGE